MASTFAASWLNQNGLEPYTRLHATAAEATKESLWSYLVLATQQGKYPQTLLLCL